MKKLVTTYAALVATAIMAATAQAATYTFIPNSTAYGSDLGDLDHHYAYGWGIYGTQSGGNANALKSFLATPNAFISSATLRIDNINNWDNNSNRLYMNMLSNPAKGVVRSPDNPNDNVFSDFFASGATVVDLLDWSDLDGTANPNFDLVYNLLPGQLTTLTGFITDPTVAGRAIFGLGFDPDCHFYNDRVCFTITTDSRKDSVPDGGTTALMLGGAFAAIAMLRRAQARK